jgi:acyl-CoA synthetase (NDP forming)
MKNASSLNEQINDLFFPKSIALVGVPREMKAGRLLLSALIDQGFPGHIYPVHPEASEIDGLKVYPSVSAIAGPVDLAIILVKHHLSLPVVRECASRGVKGAVLFTAGYSETGTDEGKALEEEIVRTARSSGMRLIGPNCMGLYCPESGLSFFPGFPKVRGPVGLISHSGSLSNMLIHRIAQKGLRFSSRR